MNQALLDNLGRPRHALVVGPSASELAHALRGRVNDVVALESQDDEPSWQSIDGRRFDLVVLDGVLAAARDPGRLLERARERLVDGGHVLVSMAAGARADVPGLLGAAGLEVLRSDVEPRILREAFPPVARVVDDLRLSHLGPVRAAGGLVRPIERAVARHVPERFVAERLWIARRRPAPAPLTLTVGMLTLDEVDSIERMIDDIRAVAPDAKILVIDSSSDRTPELARARGARVVRQLPPQGHGPAMERLLYEAAQESDALIYLDCDFTYPTAAIPVIRGLLESGADVVNASRTVLAPGAMPLANRVANRVMAASARLVHGLPTTDVHSGLRGYRCSVIRAFSFDGSGDALPLDTLILPARSGYDVVEFPISYAERVGVSKLAKVRGVLWTYLRIAGALGRGERVSPNSPRYVVRRSGVDVPAESPPRGSPRR